MKSAEILEKIRQGWTANHRTYLRHTIINKKTLEKFEKLGLTVLRDSGDGYEMASGKKFVYLFPGSIFLTK